jgi:ADP-heptose:LPS heptosyltransferase
MKLSVRLPNTLGCTVISTVLLQSLGRVFNKAEINVFTPFPDLVEGLDEVSYIFYTDEHGSNQYDIDLATFLEVCRPQQSKPYRHLSEHIFETAEKQLGSKLKQRLPRNFSLKINLTHKEIAEAQKITRQESKPCIWVQSKSRLSEKDWPEDFWKALVSLLEDDYSFIDLSKAGYTRRLSIAITAQCIAGITLDTFLLHGSQAVHAKNIFVILVSSHPEVVTYPGQIVFDGLSDERNIRPKNVVQQLRKLLKK